LKSTKLSMTIYNKNLNHLLSTSLGSYFNLKHSSYKQPYYPTINPNPATKTTKYIWNHLNTLKNRTHILDTSYLSHSVIYTSI